MTVAECCALITIAQLRSEWMGEQPKHDYKDMVTWRMMGPSKAESDLL
jgi:hypothetical protein